MPRLKMIACINPYRPGLVWLTSKDPNVAEPYNPSVFLTAEEARRLAQELLEAARVASGKMGAFSGSQSGP